MEKQEYPEYSSAGGPRGGPGQIGFSVQGPPPPSYAAHANQARPPYSYGPNQARPPPHTYGPNHARPPYDAYGPNHARPPYDAYGPNHARPPHGAYGQPEHASPHYDVYGASHQAHGNHARPPPPNMCGNSHPHPNQARPLPHSAYGQPEHARPPNVHGNNLAHGNSKPGSINIPLINPLKPQNGFSMAVPPSLKTKLQASGGIETWKTFIQELNEVLSKIPGSVVKGIAGFGLVKLATLGISKKSYGAYQSHVVDKGMDLVERYNCDKFSAMGLVVHLNVADSEAKSACNDCSKQEKACKHAEDAQTLVLSVNYT
ncbi:hypothetical protein LPJ79_004558 [Coemansia sp. RSA 1821]|nr:hypothetical protein LPJ79_004558 [Coemansia sp. RSA 1821]